MGLTRFRFDVIDEAGGSLMTLTTTQMFGRREPATAGAEA
jgi:hypothetical protein